MSGALQHTPALLHVLASPSLPSAKGAFNSLAISSPTRKREFEAEVWRQQMR